jgi:tetratricopeptide (TPR) repeat protein
MSAAWEQAWLEQRYYEGSLPREAERALRTAARYYHDDAQAEAWLQRALAIAPQALPVHIGLYRFYFYKGRLAEALQVATQCLTMAGAAVGVQRDWRQLTAAEGDFGAYNNPGGRFFLFVLKAYGYLLLRLGRMEEGREALAKVEELDPQGLLGSATLLDVVARQGRDDDDD